MDYKCPMYESSEFTCDRDAEYLVAGTAICKHHAGKFALIEKVDDQGKVIISSLAMVAEAT